ncbi:MAG: NAD-glutamate dehydrogenase [Steroidobacteraceae bacterium]
MAAWQSSAPHEDWRALGAVRRERLARSQLEFGAVRSSGELLLRISEAPPPEQAALGPHTLIELISDDMPFLVDTLIMTLAAAGSSIQMLLHPVLQVTRDGRGRLQRLQQHLGKQGGARESWQLLRIGRLRNADAALLEQNLRAALADLQYACTDWNRMRAALLAQCQALQKNPPRLPAEQCAEAIELLRYVEANHFTLLGYSELRLQRRGRNLALRHVSGTALGILRPVERTLDGTPGPDSGTLRRQLQHHDILLLTHSNLRATVHRPGWLDYIGVRRFDKRGRAIGEARLLGLWTSSALNADPRSVPLLRQKIAAISASFDFSPDSHDAKRLTDVLITLPRTELFQASVPELRHCVRTVMALQERRALRLVLRRDEFGRFWSCLVFLPRERYEESARRRIEAQLMHSLGGVRMDSTLALGDSQLAQLHVIIRVGADAPARVAHARLEQQLAEALLGWRDHVQEALQGACEEEAAAHLAQRWLPLLPPAYQEETPPPLAVDDMVALERMVTQKLLLDLRLHRPAGLGGDRINLRLLRRTAPLTITEAVPILENFGLRVLAEHPYALAPCEGTQFWLQDFELQQAGNQSLHLGRLRAPLLTALQAVLEARQENDGFNRLVVASALDAQGVLVLRALCRYLLQTGLPFSQSTMERTLGARHPLIAAQLWQLFVARLDPRHRSAPRAARLEATIRASIAAIPNPDEDRILRSLLSVLLATLRTNAFVNGAALPPEGVLALKLEARSIAHLPEPRPAFEIFVHGARVEGVHLRQGAVARGGIRWSERPEDFRTEVLGLMKAQHVKNTLIVPAGAKGGFIVRRLAAFSDAQTRHDEVAACYRLFIDALLQLTDNIVRGRVVPPPIVRRDGDDPYLVVAADKGTATFSDLANSIAAARSFWLGDAFASGGSEGYDHKVMGITARGAWECVKRHFRELGRDIQQQPFTVAGIGDMSGDVFGNGMLLSRQIRLVAAFNHQHIFIDPAPDAAASFKERARLFALPRSGWNDYNARLIARGGGVFERSAKLLTLPAEARTLLGLPNEPIAPADVIRAILRMPVDLLWNGGIGTYVKARSERNGEIGDRANDALRLDASELHALVVGEGGNLGFSQRARIEYALNGGRINTDAVDNSAGVNTSDVEVNLKILIDNAARRKPTPARRRQLIASCTDEVAQLVLRNNYLQSQALSLLQSTSARKLGTHQWLIRWLERHAGLNRALEFLPDDDQFEERRAHNQGLTRPELAQVIAWSKIALAQALGSADLGNDSFLKNELARYFPTRVRRAYASAIARHRLRRELLATSLTNSMVHRLGPGFVPELLARNAAPVADIVRAYAIAREAGGLRELWSGIEALDLPVAAAEQYHAHRLCNEFLAELIGRLLAICTAGELAAVGPASTRLRTAWRELSHSLLGALPEATRSTMAGERARLQAAGFPAPLAQRLAALPQLRALPELAQLMRAGRQRAARVAAIWVQSGEELGLEWLEQACARLPGGDAWSLAASESLQQRLRRVRLALVRQRLNPPPAAAATQPAAHRQWQQTLSELRQTPQPGLAAISVAVRTLEELQDAWADKAMQ